MQKISEIFYKGMTPENNSIIKTVKINWYQHIVGMVNLARSFEPKFRLRDNTEKVLRLMLMYFSGDPDFLKGMGDFGLKNASLDKGILLVGGVGTGKSLLFKIFKKYTGEIIRVNSFQYHTSQSIIDNVNVSGVDELELYNHNHGRPITCYIDDIASSNESIKHYGTEINAMEQLLSLRYNVYSRYRKLTHATSNKYPSEMLKLYDERIVDRMKEMFNIIELDGDSFRK